MHTWKALADQPAAWCYFWVDGKMLADGETDEEALLNAVKENNKFEIETLH